jgi:hypothetical protein
MATFYNEKEIPSPTFMSDFAREINFEIERLILKLKPASLEEDPEPDDQKEELLYGKELFSKVQQEIEKAFYGLNEKVRGA